MCGDGVISSTGAIHNGQKILLVTKFRYLGDTIVATPVFRRLREALPDSVITLLAGPAIPMLLQGNKYLTDIWGFDPKNPGGFRGNKNLVTRIKTHRFDAVILLNRSLQSAIIAQAAGIPIRIGHDTEFRGPLLTHKVKYDWNKQDVECSFDLLRAVDIPGYICLPKLNVTEEEQESARDLLMAKGWSGKPIICIQPGANDPLIREWGADRYARTGDILAAELGMQVVITGSGEELGSAKRTAQAMKSGPILMAGETNLRQALGLISIASLWVGNDGGMLHAATALGTPSVGIFGPTKARRWGYDHAKHKSVTHIPGRPVPKAKAKAAAAIRTALDAITVEEVVAAAYEVLRTDRSE
ncbi:MAG: lipopolysaccharide heptosyltransferase II [Chthonomonadales bacterium]